MSFRKKKDYECVWVFPLALSSLCLMKMCLGCVEIIVLCNQSEHFNINKNIF